MSCYLVQEIDGTSRFTLEDGSGFLLLEQCPDGAPDDHHGNIATRRPSRAPWPEFYPRDEEEILMVLTEL